MFVEVIYGLISNSLGLLTDGAHMLLDCSAIIIGLYCRYLTTKRKNNKYNFGYARSEVVGTFINSVFLIFISIYIVFEALARSIQPKHIHGENLMIISFLGLLVNLIGIYFFHGEHGFHNHECSHSHSHSHGNNSNSTDKNISNMDLNNFSSEVKLKNNFDEENNFKNNSSIINNEHSHDHGHNSNT